MPYALFSNDAKLSKAYPTEADVWKVASKSGLVIDVATDEEKAHPQRGPHLGLGPFAGLFVAGSESEWACEIWATT